MAPLVSRSRSKRSKKFERATSARINKRQPRPWSGYGLLVLMWLTTCALLIGVRPYYYPHLNAGQTAPTTIVAVAPFECMDLARSELNRLEAADAIRPVFAINEEPLLAATHTLDKLFDKVNTWQLEMMPTNNTAEERLEELRKILAELHLNLTPAEVLEIVPENNTEQLLVSIRDACREIWMEGIASEQEKTSGFQSVASSGEIYLEATERIVALESLRLPQAALSACLDLLKSKPGETNVPRATLAKLLQSFFRPNLQFNPQKTQALRTMARRSVTPEAKTIRVGSILISRGEEVNAQVVEMLSAHDQALRKAVTFQEQMHAMLGRGLVLLAGIFICAAMLHLLNSSLLSDHLTLLLLMTLSFFILLFVRGVIFTAAMTNMIKPTILPFLFPLALAPLLAGILVGGVPALIFGFWISIATAVMHGNDFSVLLIGMAVSVVAALSTRHVHRRSHIFRSGLWIGLVMAFFTLGDSVLTQPDLRFLFAHALYGFLNGFACALIVILTLPLLEVLFLRTTDIRLLEFCDMGHPLLQRMAIEALGTYHHSLNVALLAQAAAAAIGGNELVVRVCSYFHDIGKLTKPEFFIENQQLRDNPHDNLTPSMSTLVIMSHVKEGASMAMRYKLPKVIIDGIRQHHGTSIITFFFLRARKQCQEQKEHCADGQVDEKQFRYQGPRPHSRELAILSIADCVEAASRSLDKPTPSRIENLVNEIVNGRLRDGQLDDSGLTFKELSAVKTSFVFTLTNMMHSRIAYPQDEHRDKQSAEKNGH